MVESVPVDGILHCIHRWPPVDDLQCTCSAGDTYMTEGWGPEDSLGWHLLIKNWPSGNTWLTSDWRPDLLSWGHLHDRGVGAGRQSRLTSTNKKTDPVTSLCVHRVASPSGLSSLPIIHVTYLQLTSVLKNLIIDLQPRNRYRYLINCIAGMRVIDRWSYL